MQKHSKYKYTYYQNTYITKPTHTHTHILQNKLNQTTVQDTHQIK